MPALAAAPGPGGKWKREEIWKWYRQTGVIRGVNYLPRTAINPTEMWQKDRSADAAGRLDNLKELVRSMEEFENLAGFLEHISLVMDREQGEGEQAVNLMTLHSAKGLEWQCVFVIWIVDGRFPSVYSFAGDEELEEERRLFYVSVTRAKRHLYLTYPINVFDRGSGMVLSKPSRFLDPVSPALLDQLALMEEGGRPGWYSRDDR